MTQGISGEVSCKYCHSGAVVKFGTYKGVQRYWCKVCKRKFKDDENLFRMRVKPEYISHALSEYYRGLSIGDIADTLKQETGYRPSKHVVFNWVDKYTNAAINHFMDYKPKVGDTWVADETVLDLDGQKIWLFDLIDTKTRSLLASRLSRSRTTMDAQILIDRAIKTAGKPPKVAVTDKLPSYLDISYGKDAEHRQGSPFSAEASTSLIERFHGTLKDRTKVMRGFRDFETLSEFINGFITYYNFMRPHEALEGKTPAEVAKIDYDVKNWADVCHISVISQHKPRSSRARIELPIIQIGRPRKRHRQPRKPVKIQPSLSEVRSIR